MRHGEWAGINSIFERRSALTWTCSRFKLCSPWIVVKTFTIGVQKIRSNKTLFGNASFPILAQPLLCINVFWLTREVGQHDTLISNISAQFRVLPDNFSCRYFLYSKPNGIINKMTCRLLRLLVNSVFISLKQRKLSLYDGSCQYKMLG